MWGIVAVLMLGGVYNGWMDMPSAELVSTVTGLTVGEMVHVRDVHGQSVKGKIVDVSAAGLRIVEGGQSVIVAADEVQTVQRQDSLINGVLLGLAGGLVGLRVGGERVCGEEAAVCGLAIAFPLSLAAGAAIGAGVDAIMHGTLYRRRNRRQVGIVPAVSHDGIGVGWYVSW